MDIQLKWTSDLSFDAHPGTGRTIQLGSSVEDTAPKRATPMELLLIAVAGCTAMDVLSILQKKRYIIDGFEVTTSAERAEVHPRVFTHIVIDYMISGKRIDPQAVERAIELSKTKYCPALAMLQPIIEVDHRYAIMNTSGIPDQ